MTDSPLLSLAEAAAYLRVTQDWLRIKAARGEIASRKVGRARRFTQADLDGYIDSCAQVAANPMLRSPQSRSRNRRTS